MFKQNKGENSLKRNDELFNYMLKGNQGEHHLRSILHTTKELHGKTRSFVYRISIMI